MIRTLVLHIGAHRTATSSIQAYLFANRQRLRRQGFLYPFKTKRHLDTFNAIFSGRTTAAEIAAKLKSRRRQDGPLHTAILSDEDVCARQSLAPIAAFREHFDVKVVYAIRRQDLWLESWYLQNVKWQWNKDLAHISWNAFLRGRDRFHWIDYDRTVAELERTFGAQNVIVYVHEADQMPGGPIATFCDRVGITDRTGFAAAPYMNASRSVEVSELMRRLPLSEFSTRHRSRFERAFSAVDKSIRADRRGTPLLMSPLRRRYVMRGYAKGNANLARRRFGRDALFLEPLPPWTAPVSLMRLPPTDTLVDEMLVPLVRALVSQWEADEARAAEKTEKPREAAE